MINFLTSFGLWAVFGGMIFESAGFPIPSEIVLPFAGFLVYQGKADFWLAVLVGSLGGTVGSILAYWIGLYGGRPLLERYGRYIFIKKEEILVAEQWFERYGSAAVFFGRLLPAVRTYISFPPGIAKMRFSLFVLYTFVGSFLWGIPLTYAGVALGAHWDSLHNLFHVLDMVVIAGIVILAVYLYRRWQRKKV